MAFGTFVSPCLAQILGTVVKSLREPSSSLLETNDVYTGKTFFFFFFFLTHWQGFQRNKSSNRLRLSYLNVASVSLQGPGRHSFLLLSTTSTALYWDAVLTVPYYLLAEAAA